MNGKKIDKLWTALNTAGVIIESEMINCELNKEYEKWEQWHKSLVLLGRLEERVGEITN